MINNKQRIRTFIILVLGWTYTFWIIAAVISSTNPVWPGIQALHFLGGIGPLVATIYVVSKKNSWQEYLGRLFNFSGLFPTSWLIIISPIMINLGASLLANGKISISQDFINQGVIYAVFLFFFGPLPEELGWRGVLFDSMHNQSILKAQTITAAVWFLWHLPLFFIVGSYQWGIGFATSGFVLWSFSLILQSFVMGDLYILSRRSIASAVLFHYVVNLAGEALDMNAASQSLTLVLYAVLAVILGFVDFKTRIKLATEN